MSPAGKGPRWSRPASPQAMILGLALVGWPLAGADAWWTLALAYLVAWAGVSAFGLTLPRWGLALVLGAPLLTIVGRLPVLAETEHLTGVLPHLADRARLERPPIIAPPLVRTDQPQRFWVHAPGASSLRLRLGARGATLEATALGHGLFFADYDPRRHGAPREGSGPSRARVLTDIGDAARELQVVQPGPHPRWFCRSPAGTLAASPSEETDELYLVDPRGRVHVAAVGDGPSDCAFLSEDRLVLTRRYTAELWVLDRRGRVQRRLPWRSGAGRLARSPSGRRLAIAEPDAVAVLDATTFEVAARVAIARPDWLAFADEDTLVVSQRRPAVLRRLQAGWGWSPGPPLLLGRPAVTMAPIDGGVVAVTTDYRPDGQPHLGNHFVQDQLLEVDAAGWFVRRQTLTQRRSPRQGAAGDVDRGVSPMGLEALPDGGLRVAFAGTDEVWRLGAGVPEITDTADAPAPHGVVTFASGSWSVASPSAGTIATRLPSGRWRVVALEGGDPARRRGERGFYEATRSGVSCQSCHLHGDTDFVLRNIGGRRLAPTLGVGGVLGTSPFLRDGSYPRVRDLNQHLSQGLLRGFLRRAPRRGLDLEAFVHGLPRRPPARRTIDLRRARAGLEAFVQARCPTCHTLGAFTNLSQHPLGALFGPVEGRAPDEVLDTPSLLSVGTHAPYLSDGRAETLADVLGRHNEANRHGDTRGLSDEEAAALVYFLEVL